MDVKQLIGLRIKQVRQARGISQEALSEKIGMSSKYLSSIERGKENPTLDTFVKLAKALNVEILELFNFAHEKSPKELKQLIGDFMKGSDVEKLQLAARIIKAIYL
jgi:transcriptional regulator with XRE-family HTH domain